MHLQLVICVAVSVFTLTVHGQYPQIVDEILIEVKRIDGIGRLNCTVVNKGTNKVLWTHYEGGQQLSSDRSILVDNPINPQSGLRKYEVHDRANGQRETYMLVVNNLKPEDQGSYYCTVQVQGQRPDQYPRKRATLTVQVPPAIRPAITSAFLQVAAGTLVNLRCSASGNPAPNITWVRADGNLLPTGATQYRGAVLVIKNVTKYDRGIYKCVANNNIPTPAEATCQLLVFFAPMVKAVQDTKGQAQNRRFNAKLECVASGHPLPSLTWYRLTGTGSGGKVPITDDDKYDVNKQYSLHLMDGEIWYSLKVKNVQANDYTNYTCEARNNQGTAFAQVKLFETMECQGPNCPSLGTGAASSMSSSTILLAIVMLLVMGVWKVIK